MLIKIVKSQHGFGFFGMMVLVIVLAVMGSIVMVTIDTTTSNQAMNETIQKMERLQAAIERYNVDNSATLPLPALSNLYARTTEAVCAANPATSKMINWCGPYLDQIVSNNSTDYTYDGWGTVFVYSYNGAAAVGSRNTLRSWGPNKTDNAGGSDDITRSF